MTVERHDDRIQGGMAAGDPNDDICKQVRELVRSLAPREVETVDSNARLEADLAFDSLTLVELAVRLEREFALPDLGDQAMDLEIETVGDIEGFVVNLVGSPRT
jgi:acyl carrier protein